MRVCEQASARIYELGHFGLSGNLPTAPLIDGDWSKKELQSQGSQAKPHTAADGSLSDCCKGEISALGAPSGSFPDDGLDSNGPEAALLVMAIVEINSRSLWRTRCHPDLVHQHCQSIGIEPSLLSIFISPSLFLVSEVPFKEHKLPPCAPPKLPYHHDRWLPVCAQEVQGAPTKKEPVRVPRRCCSCHIQRPSCPG